MPVMEPWPDRPVWLPKEPANACRDIIPSMAWYAALFGRQPDANPMDGLAEWHHGDGAGFQLFQDTIEDGHGTMTLIVSGIEAERKRLHGLGLHPPEIEAGPPRLLHLRDPDGNRVVLAEPE